MSCMQGAEKILKLHMEYAKKYLNWTVETVEAYLSP